MDVTSIAGSARSVQQPYNQLQNAAAYQNSLQGLANSDPYRNITKAQSKPKQPELRTPEQIQEQLEARYAEMVEEAKLKEKAALTACSICRWSDGAWCRNPLVIGIEQKSELIADRGELHAKLCGPEKALFEPKRTRWQRFVDWFLEPWMEDLALTDKKA